MKLLGTGPGNSKWSYCFLRVSLRADYRAKARTSARTGGLKPRERMSRIAWREKLSSTFVYGWSRTWPYAVITKISSIGGSWRCGN